MDYDMIQIQIEAEAKKANSSVDALVNKLNKLSNSLTSVGGAPMYNLASGVDRLGVSMQQVSAVRTAEFSRLSRNIEKISSINAGQIIYSATAINSLGESIEKMGVSSANAQGIADIAGNISKLGNKGVQNAVTNIPLLATSLNELMVVLSNSPAVNQNLIDMTNALANLASQGSKVGTASNTLVNGMNRTSTAMQRTRTNTFSLASAFGKFYASYFLVIRGIKGLWTSVESTADYIEAFNYFNVAFGKVSSEWSQDWEKYGYENAQAYADSFTERINETLGKLSGINVKVSADGEGLLTSTNMKNLGLNIQEVTQYASQLASITNAVGQTGETTLAVSDAFTKLAGDISSLFNVDYSQVSNNLQSALIGMSRSVYKYGIDITNATLQTLAYELGIEKAVSEMTQMEKQQLRVISILRQSKVSWGDLANTINSPSNMIRQLSTNLKEVSMVLGQLFIPLLTKVLPIINGLAIALKNVLVDFANLAGIKINFSEFGQGYNEAEEGLSGIEEGIDGVNDSLKKANKSLRFFDELLTIGTENQNMSETQDMLDLTSEILKATEEYNAVWNSAFEEMENKAQEFADKIYSTFTSNDWSSVGEKLGEGLITFVNNVDDWINKIDWEKLGEQLSSALENVPVDEIALSIGKLVLDIAKASIEIAWGSLESAYEKYGLAGVFASVMGYMSGAGVIGAVSARIALKLGFDVTDATGVSDWFDENIKKPLDDKIEPVKKLFDDLAQKLSSTFENVWKDITGFFDTAKEKIVTTWTTVSSWFSENVSEPIKKAFDGIKERAETAWEGVEIIWEGISKWFSEDVVDPLLKVFEPIGDSISSLFSDAWEDIKEAWKSVSGWFEENVAKPVGKIFENITESFKKMFSNAWQAMISGVRETINNVISVIEGGVNFLIGGINDVIEKYNSFVRLFDKDWEGVKLVSEISIPRVSMPTGQSNLNPLISKQIERDLLNKSNTTYNGNLAVEVGRATYEGIKKAMEEASANTTEQKTVVQIDGNEVFNVVQKRANNYFNATGNSAFAY